MTGESTTQKDSWMELGIAADLTLYSNPITSLISRDQGTYDEKKQACRTSEGSIHKSELAVDMQTCNDPLNKYEKRYGDLQRSSIGSNEVDDIKALAEQSEKLEEQLKVDEKANPENVKAVNKDKSIEINDESSAKLMSTSDGEGKNQAQDAPGKKCSLMVQNKAIENAKSSPNLMSLEGESEEDKRRASLH